MGPEAEAREKIDALLGLCGWAVCLRARLVKMPFALPLVKDGIRQCQIEAITGLETSLVDDRPRALIQMATGAGTVPVARANLGRQYHGPQLIRVSRDAATVRL